MTAKLLYRIAAGLLILFAIGHTVGFVKFKPTSPEGLAVLDGMNKVHFQVGNASFSYGQFYTGFGLLATAYLLFAAFLAWCLGSIAAKDAKTINPLAWGFVVLQLASLLVCWLYFLAPPVVLSGLLVICTGSAAWMAQRTRT